MKQKSFTPTPINNKTKHMKKNNSSQNKKYIFPRKLLVRGFTLIELLVGVTIFVIVVVVGLAVVVTLTRNRSKTETLSNVQQSGNLAMEMIADSIQSASGIPAPSGSQLTIGTKTFGCTDCSATGNSGYIWMQVGGVNQKLTSPDVKVTNLAFSGAADSATIKGYVTIEMTLQSTWARSNEAPLTLHTTVIPQL